MTATRSGASRATASHTVAKFHPDIWRRLLAPARDLRGRSKFCGMSAEFDERAVAWAGLMKPESERPVSSARGVHHAAFICSDVTRTIAFYQDLLGFPLVELFENRDYPASAHL